MDFDNLIGFSDRNISDFHIYHKHEFFNEDKKYSICTVFVDGCYEALLVNDSDIVLKSIIYAREKFNLYQLLFNKTGIQEYGDMVNERWNKDRANEL